MRCGSFFHVLLLSMLSLHVETQFIRHMDVVPEVVKDPEIVIKDWKKQEELVKYVFDGAVKAMMPLLMDNAHSVNISSTCVRDSIYLFAGIRKLQTWALKFVDSSAKAIDGILTGGFFFYGSYDECVDTVAINQRSGKHKGEVMFTGKYCTLRIKTSHPPKKTHFKLDEIMDEFKGVFKKGTVMEEMVKYVHYFHYASMRLGLCIPSGCSVDDVNQMFSKVANYTRLYMNVKRCEVKEDVKFTPLMIFVIFLYSLAGFMVLFGTAVDVYSSYNTKKKLNKKSLRPFLVFSIVSNFRKFADTSTSSKYLSCLNAIRFMTMSWVIMGHSFILQMHQLVSGLEYIRYMMDNFAIQVILNATLSVETFFFISGLLVCYVTTNHVVVAKREFNIKVYIIHRLFRILPAYIFVILFVFISGTISSGPIAHDTIQPFIDGCKKNWWASLLFINNFYNAEDMCMPHGWFLSLDMQLYIGSLIILLPLFRWPKVGISIAAVFIVGFTVACGVITYVRGYPPTMIFSDPNPDQLIDFAVGFYFKPYPHACSYIIGILVGYLLAIKPKLRIPKVTLYCGWSAAIICSMTALYGPYEWNTGKDPTLWETVIYASLHRSAWVLGIAWMVVCCATGYGGIINYILSWKMWIPLGRLTFMAYLIHPLLQEIFYADIRNTFQATVPVGVWAFLGHLIVTYAVAFVGSMLIESPLIALEKILLARGEAEMAKKSKNDTEWTSGIRVQEVQYKEDMDTFDSNPHLQQSSTKSSYNRTDNLNFNSRL